MDLSSDKVRRLLSLFAVAIFTNELLCRGDNVGLRPTCPRFLSPGFPNCMNFRIDC